MGCTNEEEEEEEEGEHSFSQLEVFHSTARIGKGRNSGGV
jgi:hypothetical protein